MKNLLKKYWFIDLLALTAIFAFCSISMAFNFEPPYRVSTEYMPIKNGQLEYYRFGQGSPIVLITGFGNTVSHWNRQFLNELSQHHEVIIFNNRNVGDSIVRSNRYNTTELANDTLQLIEGLNIKKPAVLGFSMGGMIAQQLAIMHPEKISHLILLNTAIAGSRSIAPDERIQDIMSAPLNSGLKHDVEVLDAVSPPGWRIRVALGAKFDHFKPFNHRESLPTTFVLHQQKNLILDWSKNEKAAHKLAHLKMPVLILNGGEDSILPPANSKVLAETIPHAAFIRWDNGGHSMMFQHPRAIANAVINFID